VDRNNHDLLASFILNYAPFQETVLHVFSVTGKISTAFRYATARLTDFHRDLFQSLQDDAKNKVAGTVYTRLVSSWTYLPLPDVTSSQNLAEALSQGFDLGCSSPISKAPDDVLYLSLRDKVILENLTLHDLKLPMDANDLLAFGEPQTAEATHEEALQGEAERTAERWLLELALSSRNQFEKEGTVEIVRAGTRLLNSRLAKAREQLRDECLLRNGLETAKRLYRHALLRCTKDRAGSAETCTGVRKDWEAAIALHGLKAQPALEKIGIRNAAKGPTTSGRRRGREIQTILAICERIRGKSPVIRVIGWTQITEMVKRCIADDNENPIQLLRDCGVLEFAKVDVQNLRKAILRTTQKIEQDLEQGIEQMQKWLNLK
jgi:hypothetical protein